MPEKPTKFRLRPALRLRVVGMACLWLGLALLLDVLRRSVPALDRPALLAVEWLLVAIFAVVAGWVAWTMLSRGAPLAMDAAGFRNQTTWRRDSVRTARWTDVADVRRVDGAAGTVFVLELADGRSSLIASRLLDVPAQTLEEQLRDRLNDAHGYRPL
ncbi:hypothetical protein ABN028_21365 [Actinopolymorpha sp. B17G11]|uniref:hypothetical protein n=1 Tax=unclassified Actinopolymorpha TaxID=2627063 RepID=UPI0032D97F7B